MLLGKHGWNSRLLLNFAFLVPYHGDEHHFPPVDSLGNTVARARTCQKVQMEAELMTS